MRLFFCNTTTLPALSTANAFPHAAAFNMTSEEEACWREGALDLTGVCPLLVICRNIIPWLPLIQIKIHVLYMSVVYNIVLLYGLVIFA